MDRRIFGLETEYGVTCTYRGQRRLSPGRGGALPVPPGGVLGAVQQRLPAQRRPALPRRRLATRSTPRRSATPCPTWSRTTGPGSGSCEGLLVDAEKRLHDEGIAGEIYLFKNNTDSAGNSYGCHENYLVSRHGEFGRLADVLIPFLVTRQLICGAGKVLQTPRGAVYCLSQRAEHIWEGVSSRDHPVPADHQHPGRAARRRRAVPPAARDRRRLEHERGHHAAQGRAAPTSCCG